MSTAPGRIMANLSIKALRNGFPGRVADHPDETSAISAVGVFFPGPDVQGVEHRPVCALDTMELKRTDPLRPLIQVYCLLLLLRWRRGLRGGCCAYRRIRERIGQELADNLRHVRRGYEIVVTVARHDRQPRLRQRLHPSLHFADRSQPAMD
jgi:hypothetical protein